MKSDFSRRNFLVGSSAALIVAGVGISTTPASAATLSVAEIERGLWKAGTDGVYKLPVGTYFLDRTLVMPPRRTLDATGSTISPAKAMRELVRIYYRCTIRGGTWNANKGGDVTRSITRSMITNETGPSANAIPPSQFADNSRVENAKFRNVNGENDPNFFAAIRLERTRGSSVEGCNFDGYYRCIDAVSARSLKVTNNEFSRLLDGVVLAPEVDQAPKGTAAGSFLVLGGRQGRGGCNGVVVERNRNPRTGDDRCVGSNEVGGHLIATTIGDYKYTHDNIVIHSNRFFGYPAAWTETDERPNITRGTGDMIAIKNTKYFEVYNNFLGDSGEFGITAVAGSGRAHKQSKIYGNHVYRADGCGIVVGGEETRRVENVLVDNNYIIDAGMNRGGDLDPKDGQGRPLQGPGQSPQINYPNARAGLRLWSATNVELRNNKITNYRSSAIWIKSDQWKAGSYRAENEVRNMMASTKNTVSAHSAVYQGGSRNQPGTIEDSFVVHTPSGWSGLVKTNNVTTKGTR